MYSCTVAGPVISLLATSGVVQLTISWSPPTEPNGVIIAYEVYSNSSGYTNTSATQLTLRDISPNTVVTYSVIAYTIIGPGASVTGQASTGSVRELLDFVYVILIPLIAIVSGVSVAHVEEICPAVRVSWTQVNLSVVDHYTVHYTTVGGVNGTLTFPASASSGVVSGLQEGRQYQFSVTVALKINEKLFIGTQRSVITQINFCNASMEITASTEITSSALSITGWILFAVTLIVSIILMVCLVLVLRRHYREKQ